MPGSRQIPRYLGNLPYLPYLTPFGTLPIDRLRRDDSACVSERVRQFVCVCSLLTWTGSTGFPKPSPVRCLYGTYGIGWQQQHAVPSLPYRPSHCVCARAWRIPGPSLNLACIQFNSTSSLGTPAHRLLSTPDIGSNHLLFFFALNNNFLPFPLPAAIILAWFFCLLPPAFFSLPAVFLLTVCLPFRTDAAPIRFFFLKLFFSASSFFNAR